MKKEKKKKKKKRDGQTITKDIETDIKLGRQKIQTERQIDTEISRQAEEWLDMHRHRE